jgi:hypothetical protein
VKIDPSIRAFSQAMQRELDLNSHKTHWMTLEPTGLLDNVYGADVANTIMMFCEKYKTI